jgi:hypothetical protein
MITPLPKQALISENLEFTTTHVVGDMHTNRNIYENSKEKQRNDFFSLRAHIIAHGKLQSRKEKKKKAMHGPCRGAGGGARAGC